VEVAMKKMAYLFLVVSIFMAGDALADCWGKTEVVLTESSGFQNVTEFECWPIDNIVLKKIEDYVVFKGTMAVGSPMKIEERENLVYICPSEAEKHLILTLNGRKPTQILHVWENRTDKNGTKKSNYAKVYFSVLPGDLPNSKPSTFNLVIKPRKVNVEFAFKPEFLSKK
jgi:hypothetical protein